MNSPEALLQIISRRDGRSFSLTLSLAVTVLFILPPRGAKVASLETLARCCRAARWNDPNSNAKVSAFCRVLVVHGLISVGFPDLVELISMNSCLANTSWSVDGASGYDNLDNRSIFLQELWQGLIALLYSNLEVNRFGRWSQNG